MSYIVYISCDYNERKLDEVKQICEYLFTQKVTIKFAPLAGTENFYNFIAKEIESSHVFLIICSTGYSCSTWLNIELDYAIHLRKARRHILNENTFPEIFGVKINNSDLPKSSQCYDSEITWIKSVNKKELKRLLV